VFCDCRERPLAGAFHPSNYLAHGQDFYISPIAELNQPFQDVSEHGEAVARLREIFGMKAEMKYPPISGGCFQPSSEAFDTRSQGDKSGPC
jgi:hypothetical protein